MTRAKRSDMSALVLSPAAPDPIATVADPPETQVHSNARRNKTVVAVLVLLTLLIGFWPLFDQAALPMDEGTLLVYPELVSHGQLPYRDFETFYGPANLWVLSAAFSTFGTNIFVERGVGLLYRVIVLLAIFGIAQRWGTILAAGVMFIAGMLLLPLQLPAYAWMGALACGLTALLVLTFGESKLRCFIAGLIAGFALLFRPDVGPAMLLSALPFLYTVSLKRRLSYFGGIAAGLLPLCVLTLLAGPVQVLNNLFLFPVIHCNPARRFPLFSVGLSLLGLLLLHAVACAANFAAGFVALRRDHSKVNARLLLGATLFSAGLTSQATQRLDMLHFFLVGFLSISLLPISLALLASAGRAYQSSRAVAFLAIFSVIALVGPIAHEATSVMWDAFSTAFDTSRVRVGFVNQRDRSFPFQSLQTARAAGKMFENLEVLSKSGERLFVGPADLRRTNGCDTFIYHLFPKLRPATYFLEMNPFSANRPGSRLAADVRSADWLVLNREQDARQEPNRSVEAGSDGPNTVVQTCFSLIGEYPPYLLFRRKP
jgi:hypothetical protein